MRRNKIVLQPIAGLDGPRDLRMEEFREYDFGGRTYRITNPIAFYSRVGGTTHRVVDGSGLVHCVPAPGVSGCVLRWKNRGAEAGADPVTY